MAMAKSATQNLQEIFASYDTSGDGTLSVEEMQQVFEELGIRGSAYLFKQIDKNKDGQLQVHEFISWLTKKDPKCSVKENVSGGSGNIVATVTNTNTKVAQKVSFTFSNCQNVDFSEGKSISLVLQPGEQREQPLLTVTGEPYNYTNTTWSSAPNTSDCLLIRMPGLTRTFHMMRAVSKATPRRFRMTSGSKHGCLGILRMPSSSTRFDRKM